jgi:8-oxo-dGTP pyrophosphatase MutT (NUDIX family)
MLPVHEEALAEAIAAGRDVLVLDDKSLGAVVIALHGPPGTEGPVIAMIAGRTSTAEPPFWSFPKGHPDAGEDDVTAALREVREEIGVDAAPYIHPGVFEEQSYTFTSRLHTDRWRAHPAYPNESRRPNTVSHKLVRYYLCVLPEAVPLKLQEAEVAAAEWVPLGGVLARMPRADMREPFEAFLASDAVRKRLR